MTEKKEIENNLLSLINEFEETFGEGAVTLLEQDNKKKNKEAISSGSFLLDNITWRVDKGAYIKGKIIEVSGFQSSGKSTLAFHAVRECQKKGENAVYFDLENAVDIEYLKNIGVDTKKLIFPYPKSGEETFDMIIKFIEMDVGLIVVDSVSNLVPKAQLESNVEKTKIGSHASLMSIGLRKIKNKLIGKKTIIFFINQIRNNINTSFFVNPEVTTGGLALQYESDLRLRLKFKEKLEKDRNNNISGIKIEVRVIKNRFSRPFGVVELEIIYPFGINKNREILRLAVEKGIIKKNANWFSYNEKKIGCGFESVVSFFESKENKNIFLEIEKQVIQEITKEQN